MAAELLTGEEQVVYGDSGYLGAEKRSEVITRNKAGKRIRYKINRRPSQSKHNTNRSRAQIKRREHEKSSVRAKVEHVFAVVKQQQIDSNCSDYWLFSLLYRLFCQQKARKLWGPKFSPIFPLIRCRLRMVDYASKWL